MGYDDFDDDEYSDYDDMGISSYLMKWTEKMSK